ncbi:helix-turn-helix domain-containing protein [Paenibacillus amylolyticus]|uniref:helix-turn-helix domain-containing protein n=1 Tax=Paenibacillus amylolyticus TaxID=1451 RepID=UPI003EBE97EB
MKRTDIPASPPMGLPHLEEGKQQYQLTRALPAEDEHIMKEKVNYMDQVLSAHLPGEDAEANLIHTIVQQIEQERDILRVDELSARWNLHTRKLQRLFKQYVGISPKTVIQLYRLQNAAECMERGLACDLGKLSQDLGYHDQSHFIKDFKSIIGSTPEEYMQLSLSLLTDSGGGGS